MVCVGGWRGSLDEAEGWVGRGGEMGAGERGRSQQVVVPRHNENEWRVGFTVPASRRAGLGGAEWHRLATVVGESVRKRRKPSGKALSRVDMGHQSQGSYTAARLPMMRR